MHNTGRRGRRVLASFAIVVLASAFAALVPAPVLARGGTVEAMIAAAQREFDAGNFARAGGLFLAIWRQGPSSDRAQLAALYNAARAYQLAEELDQAEALFRELAAYPGIPAEVASKAATQLEAVVERRADLRASMAAKAERDGNMRLAASLWADALGLRPARLDWVLRRSRALQLAGEPAAARQGYQAWLNASASSDPQRPQVERWLRELGPDQASTQSSSGPAQGNGGKQAANATPEKSNATPATKPAGAVRPGGLGNDVLEPGQFSAGLEFSYGAETGAGPRVRVGLPRDTQVSVWAGWLGSAVLGGDWSRVVLGAGGSTSLGVGVGFWTWLDQNYGAFTRIVFEQRLGASTAILATAHLALTKHGYAPQATAGMRHRLGRSNHLAWQLGIVQWPDNLEDSLVPSLSVAWSFAF